MRLVFEYRTWQAIEREEICYRFAVLHYVRVDYVFTRQEVVVNLSFSEDYVCPPLTKMLV